MTAIEVTYQHAYPPHAVDSGPLMPTTTGGLICGKCHEKIDAPDFGVLGHARTAHKASGEPMIDLRRPSASRLTALDLTPDERASLLRIDKPKGKGMTVKASKALPLVLLGMVQEFKAAGLSEIERRSLTFDGERVAEGCRGLLKRPEQVMAFVLGPEQPRRWKT